jgi:hypothetical protein
MRAFDQDLVEHQLTFIVVESDLLARILSVPIFC